MMLIKIIGLYLLVIQQGFDSAQASPTGRLLEKVINGEDAEPGSNPHQVTVQWFAFGLFWYHMCGGSVIGAKYVLTAAHCVDYAPAEEFRVIVNDHRLEDTDVGEQEIRVQTMYIHHGWIPTQDYDRKLFPNDIALLVLQTEVLDKSTIIPMASDKDEDFSGKTCTISGWGLNDTNGVIPNVLQEVNITVMSVAECDEFWNQLWPNTTLHLYSGQICVFNGEDPVNGTAACSGDSGGPLVCNSMLAGVTSWGVQGCRDQVTGEFRPSVYIRVSSYYDWIQTTLNNYKIGRG
ncbi:fibrinolytic enzyme, isozyme C-like [Ruditapes philippinarum]|uniref:fibrinolytic enzyme, isozyme C-like n=1 Tax=Ruditapes philippinarum TaxID=129788 RepID=UPI00295BA5B1|nr:fibrinolytic enzyme, isozyme C-like [Ruditapes philippinarum]